MNTTNVLTVMGAIMAVQAIAIFLGAEEITTEAFAALSPDATGIEIGAMLHEAMAVMCLMVAVILLFSRNLEPAAGAKVLMGASVGVAISTAHGFSTMFTTVVTPPLPILLIMTALVVLGFVTAMKADDAS